MIPDVLEGYTRKGAIVVHVLGAIYTFFVIALVCDGESVARPRVGEGFRGGGAGGVRPGDRPPHLRPPPVEVRAAAKARPLPPPLSGLGPDACKKSFLRPRSRGFATA